jgi:hypothetical protein
MSITSPIAFLLFLCIFGVILQTTGQVDGEFNPNHPKYQERLEQPWF